MTGFARGGLVPMPDGPHGDAVPLMLSGCDYLLPARAVEDLEPDDDSDEFICGLCLRKQCPRCRDISCGCCAGNVEDERFG